MSPKKPKPFSVTKAVKLNARDQVGQPKPGRVIVSEAKESRSQRRHKASLQEVIQEKE